MSTDAKSEDDFFTQIKTKYNICATKCCLCHKVLTDSSSIEYGIGPVCRKNGNYDDAPALDPKNLSVVIESIHAIYPEEISAKLIEKIKVSGSTSNSRQLAKLTVYYASSLVGTEKAGLMIQCIRLLIGLGYDQLAVRLLGKSYGQWVWHGDSQNVSPTFISDNSPSSGKVLPLYYKGPFNTNINAYLKTDFKGVWDSKQRHWQLMQGSRLDCVSLLVRHQLGELPPFLPQKLKLKKKVPETPISKTVEPTKTIDEVTKAETKKAIEAKMVILTIVDQNIFVTSPFNYKFKNQVKTELEGV